jgi:hypothetical protein
MEWERAVGADLRVCPLKVGATSAEGRISLWLRLVARRARGDASRRDESVYTILSMRSMGTRARAASS